ncbi:MAG: TonB-linked outer membrane protein, SusC/RagA family, partial [Bacteroidetes bacterium 38_7]
MNKHCIEERKSFNNLLHVLKIMRITLFFLFFGILFSSAANSFSQEFTFNLKSASIREICKQIEKESDYVFVFSDNSEKMIDKKVNIDANAKNVAEILDAVLSNTGLIYEIIDKQIVIYESAKIISAKVTEHKIPESIIQQPAKKQITGRVVDAQGEAIIGANIVEVGTNNGTVTDVDGNFSLS